MESGHFQCKSVSHPNLGVAPPSTGLPQPRAPLGSPSISGGQTSWQPLPSSPPLSNPFRKQCVANLCLVSAFPLLPHWHRKPLSVLGLDRLSHELTTSSSLNKKGGGPRHVQSALKLFLNTVNLCSTSPLSDANELAITLVEEPVPSRIVSLTLRRLNALP